jgi:hypothetical protein
VSQPKSRGIQAEEWVKDFAQQFYILNTTPFSLEKVVSALDSLLQFKLICARPYLAKECSNTNNSIDTILSGKKVSQNIIEKGILAGKLLDKCVATDLVLCLKDNRSTEHLIAVDVTSNPNLEQAKLDIIRGKKDPKDTPGFNRNQNIGQVRAKLGISKHLILVVNPDNPPNHEQLLNKIYGFVNQPTKTGSINEWKQTPKQKVVSPQTPQELWSKYYQEVDARSPLQRQIEIVKRALHDGHQEKLSAIISCDPFVQKMQQEQGIEKARYHIRLVINAVVAQLQPQKQVQQSVKQRRKSPKL